MIINDGEHDFERFYFPKFILATFVTIESIAYV